jgi:hypothetical protein
MAVSTLVGSGGIRARVAEQDMVDMVAVDVEEAVAAGGGDEDEE